MKSFQVLDRNQNIHCHHLLEASAGTGKTFSIQNIVLRLLLEARSLVDPLPLEKILVVTFTKAAARDVRERIRVSLEQAVNLLHASQRGEDVSSRIPDYLLGLIEKEAIFINSSQNSLARGKTESERSDLNEEGIAKAMCDEEGRSGEAAAGRISDEFMKVAEKDDEAVENVRRLLQRALFSFDRAQIFTIHSFCAKMIRRFALEGDLGVDSQVEEASFSDRELMGVIRDFFRTEMLPANFSAGQLAILLEGDPEQKKLLHLMQTSYEYPSYSSFSQVLTRFNENMCLLQERYALAAEKLIADFEAQIGLYKSYRAGETKQETVLKATFFAHLFAKKEWTAADLDGLLRDGMVWVKALDPKLLKKKGGAEVKLHYPNIQEEFAKHLFPLIEEARGFPQLLGRLAKSCKIHVRRYQMEEEKFRPDDILLKMKEGIENPLFLSSVQNAYRAAIIDEFQDTDPLQWEIFCRLFIGDAAMWKGFIYLVGDPKQSIYSFRQADIYTYLHAAKTLGKECCHSLSVNYRSHVNLVEALNALFSPEHTPGLFPLPRHATYLACLPVQAVSTNDYFVNEPRGAIHFILALGEDGLQRKSAELEERVWFPFIAQEILRLQREKNFKFSEFAVLVRDRFQALRMASYLAKMGIPYLNQRALSLVQSRALPALIELIYATLHPQDLGALCTLFGNPFIGWTYVEIKECTSWEPFVALLYTLRRTLFDVGFAPFFQEVLQADFMKGRVLVHLLEQEGGADFFRDIEQLASLVIDCEGTEWNGPEGIIPFLDRLPILEENGDERVLRFQDPAKEGVRLLTLHSSKGLEFGVVFALGLTLQTPMKEEFIPVSSEGKVTLVPFSKDEDFALYRSYCEECDAEKMRQLYVALTRAKYQLYLPVALGGAKEKLKMGEASPVDLFLARLGSPLYQSYDELYERIKTNTGKNFLEFLERIGKESHMTWSMHQEVSQDKPVRFEIKSFGTLVPPQEITIAPSLFSVESFSSLKKERSGRLLKTPPADYFCEVKTEHTLPANAETGICLHAIFEKIPFSSMRGLTSKEEATFLVRSFLQNELYKDWESVIASLVFSALTVSLPTRGGALRLCDVDSSKMYREMPFMYSLPDRGVMKGVIDLLFFHQGLYYLVDWKTNWLGKDCEAYAPPSLFAAMKEDSYDLQASIYEEAARRYLFHVEDCPFAECFGGTFYLFLRGLQPNKNTGVWSSLFLSSG